MTHFRKKPVVIEAIQWTGKNLREVIAFTDGPPDTRTTHAAMAWDDYCGLVDREGLKIFTLEGKMSAAIGDWIIKGVKGEHYPCKPDIFAATYEPAPTALPVIDPGPDSLEREIQAKANKAPRVTPADIEGDIVSEHYFTAFDGVAGAGYNEASPDGVLRPFTFEAPGSLGLLTFCVLVLRNGFTVTGESACASPENFNADIGRRIARENAVNKVWPLLGFRLRDKLAGQGA